MKLMNAYSVAVYSAQKCTIFDGSDVDQIICSCPQGQEFLPDSTQLKSIQNKILLNNASVNDSTFNDCIFNDNTKIVVIVPDDWVSISQHRIDHIVPTALAPLAALSYAVETTFSAPETLLFHYQHTVQEGKQTQLTVFACSSEWATQLCLPFQALGASCLLMCQTQWFDVSVRNRSWSALLKKSLSVYQPNKEKHKRAKRLWLTLIALSLLIHSGAYSYFLTLQQQTEFALMDRQKVLAFKSGWESAQTSSAFVEVAIALVQALPASVRLAQFDADSEQAVLQVTLPRSELAPLTNLWRHNDSSLQFKWDQTSDGDTVEVSGEEVIDVSISISKR